jgi:thiosulfate reductase/polysulfide reductase chain A
MERAAVQKKAICMWCHNHCNVSVHVKDGQLIKVEENKEHRSAALLSRLVKPCPRARNAAAWFHHQDRLNYPLKRSGEKGGGKWQQISWDQAMDEIADSIRGITERYGAEAIATSSGTGRTHDEYRCRFFSLLGSPNHVGQGHICFGPANVASSLVCGGSSMSPARKNTKCVVMWGTNSPISIQRYWLYITEVRKTNRMKLIVVDPRRTKPAEEADIWLQLRPGTDCALAMGLLNVIINEKLYDKEYVDKWCYGFDKLAERVRNYSPEKAAEITWVSADKIREAARVYAASKPALINAYMGIEQIPNCIEALHARYILTAITGNFDVKGGELIRRTNPTLISEYDVELSGKMPVRQKAKQLGSDRFKLMSFPGYDLLIENAQKMHSEFTRAHNCFAHPFMVYDAMITGKPYPIKVMISNASNPLVTQGNAKHVYKALKNLELYVVMDYWMTPSAEIADYVLPAASWLERPNIWTWWDNSAVVEVGETALPHQVDGKYDRRRDYDFWRGLGIRLGQEEFWPWKTLEDAYSFRLSRFGYTLDEFMTEKDGFDVPKIEEKLFEKIGFGTPTGKLELYSSILEKLGYDPLPRYNEPAESPISNPKLAKEYPFILITGSRHQPFFHSEHRQIDALRRLHPDPLVRINPKTATELAISDGDWVWIETPRGRVRQKCQYFDGIDPRVIDAQHGWWFPELPGEEPWLHGVWESNINVCTSDDPQQCNAISGGWPLRTLMCNIYKVKTFQEESKKYK